MATTMQILERVNSPKELKKLSFEELGLYCAELRQYIIQECATNPGHLASSLGVVELTTAIHYSYNTPHDALIWDVGHQTYPHKIITGRREAFHNKRKLGGISGFPKMSESEYDSFGGGHASVSISAAYGIAKGAMLRGERRHVIAVIGDGSMTGGLAFEGLNNLGSDPECDVLVILNDNNMAIDTPTGALSQYLLNISTSRHYNSAKNWLWQILEHVPPILTLFRTVGRAFKRSILKRSNLFESLNMRYFGTVDGHDLEKLIDVLISLQDIKGPKLLHVMTKKGKGYEPAERDAAWHAPGVFDPMTGERIKSSTKSDRYQDVFGETLLELAKMDSRVVGVTPAMLSGSSMNILAEAMAERCFDVGIAEGHAVTFSAGLASSGMVPFCNIYSTFMQRAYDNIIHDVALQNLPVILCLDRGGLVGEDGSTHHGAYDLAYLSTIPNIVVAAPRNELELRNMLYTALEESRPFAIRYPRGYGAGVPWHNSPFERLPIGVGECIYEGNNYNVVLLTIGTTAQMGCDARELLSNEGLEISHYDLRYVKPLDYALIDRVAKQYKRIITVEDGALRGGAGEAVASYINHNQLSCSVVSLGIPDRFINHGAVSELHKECGYDKDSIYHTIKQYI